MSFDNKKNEDEWFARHEKELIQNLKRDREKRQKEIDEALQAQEAQKRKELHWMKCSKCGSDMVQKTIEGMTLEECTLCGGYFLDRGELEELMMKQRQEPTSFIKKLLGIRK